MFRNLFQRTLSMVAYAAPGGTRFRPWLHRLRGVKMGENIWIGSYVWIDTQHPEAVTIGDNSIIGMRTSILAHLRMQAGTVTIEENVFIGPHCVILPNVRIGHGSVIKAGTVVTRNIPPETLYGMPQPEILGRVTVPMIQGNTYNEFVRGLRPIRSRKKKNREQKK